MHFKPASGPDTSYIVQMRVQVSVRLANDADQIIAGKINQTAKLIEGQVSGEIERLFDTSAHVTLIKPLDMSEEPVTCKAGSGERVKGGARGFGDVHKTNGSGQLRLQKFNFTAVNGCHRFFERIETKMELAMGSRIKIGGEAEIEATDTTRVQILLDQVVTVAAVGKPTEYFVVSNSHDAHRSALGQPVEAPARYESTV